MIDGQQTLDLSRLRKREESKITSARRSKLMLGTAEKILYSDIQRKVKEGNEKREIT